MENRIWDRLVNDNSKSPICNPRQIRPRNAMVFPGTDTPIPPNDNAIPPNCNPIPRNDNRVPPNDNVIPHNCKDFAVISHATAHKASGSTAKLRSTTLRPIDEFPAKPLNYRLFQRSHIIMSLGNSPVSPEDT